MRLLALIGALGLVVAIGAGAFFFGGFYSVAGTASEPDAVKWALIQVRKASIARYATDVPPSAFDDAAVMAGAKAYAARGCAMCHGAPGVAWSKFSEGLRPDPPDLKKIVAASPPAHLFWVVKNGINMTGMPSFALAGVPDPEIWSIVAFLKKLPEGTDIQYLAWVANITAAPGAAPAVPQPPAAMPSPSPSPSPAPSPQDTPAPAAPGPPPDAPAKLN